jgi:hypothetical protein
MDRRRFMICVGATVASVGFAQIPRSPVPQIVFGKTEFRTDEAAAFQKALADLNQVIASDDFRTAVHNMHAYSTKGMTNDQIYALILKSAPLKVDINVFDGSDQQDHRDRTEGYEETDEPGVLHSNRYFLAGYHYNPGYIGSLMLHEAMHVLGFKHYAVWFKRSSVPYTMNDIYDVVAKKLALQTSESVPFDKAAAEQNFTSTQHPSAAR